MRTILTAILGLFIISSADAASTESVNQLTKIQAYLNSISTIAAEFSQVAPDGSLTSGKFFLKRPGRMRWQYNPPTPLLMVASHKEIIYFDYELQQVSHFPLDSTLAGFLARERIDLGDPAIVVKNLEQASGILRLSIAEKGREDEGGLMLEFSDSPLLIRNMVITDAQGQTTTVALNNARFDIPLEDGLFEFKDPRKRRRT